MSREPGEHRFGEIASSPPLLPDEYCGCQCCPDQGNRGGSQPCPPGSSRDKGPRMGPAAGRGSGTSLRGLDTLEAPKLE